MFANGGRTLDIDNQNHIPALAQFAEHLRLKGAVAIAVNGGMLEKIPRLNPLEKRSRVKKVVIDAFLFPGPRITRRARDGPRDVRPPGHEFLAECGLAPAR